MQLIRELTALDPKLRGGAVAIGNFDGVHRGHARIIERLRERAAAVGGPAVVFTFDPHPVRLLRPADAPPPLSWTNRKAELLAALGVDALVAYPTDESLLQKTPEEFFRDVVQQALAARALVEGANFRFGHNRAGTIEVLSALSSAAGITLDVVPPVEHAGDVISSSRVRRLIATGDVEAAGALLTQPYRIRGLVTHGAGRGAKIGFPTANLEGIDTLLPAPGVYAGHAYPISPTSAGECVPAAIHIGPNLTFAEHVLKVEAHLLGFDRAL
ncbi:MAG: bifunctional riboflavin kinase/FMN adenylyltransferase, partial [Pirellulales bacterium]